ncbi:hypothetical protein O3P69_006289 [Scylla paramamosain]|uniref:Calpain catalytic domain-containing protein n=1 Tax=Scylla paramamosain TaxID=85552 RepID=A0AAW0U359_SCYPA
MTLMKKARLYRGQDYARLRSRCLSARTLFKDPEFPADEGSLGCSRDVLWKRPPELREEPRFLVDADRFSAVQGDLGDCWFVSALTAVTLNPELLVRVVPRDQGFSHPYAGIFHFRFWQGGEWVEVVVDDRLPVTVLGQLCFSRSSNPAEFWSALLEKAYAKLHGSYSALDAGKCFEATEDLTGGVTERFLLADEELPTDLFSIMVRASQRGSLLTCCVPSAKKSGTDQTETGLISSHSYCVTGVRRWKVKVPSRWKSYVELVRLRNPWGDEMEWRGAWSDNSEEWGLVSAEERKRLEVTAAGDGEFWMTYEEFKKRFDELYITSLNPQNLEDSARQRLYTLAEVIQEVLLYPEKIKSGHQGTKKWEEVNYDGSWVRNSTAGGPPQGTSLDLFSSNPQYLLHLTEADDALEVEDEAEGQREKSEKGTCSVVISLSQKNRRVNKLELLTVGICVYEVEEKRARSALSPSWFQRHRPLNKVIFKKTRTVTFRLQLHPGHYVLVPCTAWPNKEGDFLLRVFCEKAATMEENDEDARILVVRDEELGDSTDGGVGGGSGLHQPHDLRDVFWRNAGMVGHICARKLMQALNTLFSGQLEFSLDMTRSLLAMVDRDFSGTVDYYEFEPLVFSLLRWVDVYNRKKNQETKTFSGYDWQLGDALRELGYQVPRRLQGLVVVRYGDDEGNISLKDFLMATCRISVMLERFRNHSGEEDEQATLSLSDWLQDTLYC